MWCQLAVLALVFLSFGCEALSQGPGEVNQPERDTGVTEKENEAAPSRAIDKLVFRLREPVARSRIAQGVTLSVTHEFEAGKQGRVYGTLTLVGESAFAAALENGVELELHRSIPEDETGEFSLEYLLPSQEELSYSVYGMTGDAEVLLLSYRSEPDTSTTTESIPLGRKLRSVEKYPADSKSPPLDLLFISTSQSIDSVPRSFTIEIRHRRKVVLRVVVDKRWQRKLLTTTGLPLGNFMRAIAESKTSEFTLRILTKGVDWNPNLKVIGVAEKVITPLGEGRSNVGDANVDKRREVKSAIRKLKSHIKAAKKKLETATDAAERKQLLEELDTKTKELVEKESDLEDLDLLQDLALEANFTE